MKLLKRFFQFSLGSIAVLLLGVISYPIITRIISPVEMGKYSMFNTAMNLVLIFIMLGLDQAYGRYYYEEQEENRGGLLKKCIVIPLLLCVVVSILTFLFYKPITKYLIGEPSFLCALMVVFFLFGSVIYSFALLNVRMAQRAKLYSLYCTLLKIGYLVLVLLIYKQVHNNYMALVAATVFSYYIVIMVAVLIDRKYYLSLVAKNKSETKIRNIIKYSAPLILSTAASWVFQSIDKIMLKQYAGYEEIGIYTGAMAIVAMLNVVQGAFTTFWVPVAFEHYSKQPDDREFYERVNGILAFVMLLAAIFLVSFKDLIAYLLGPEYRAATAVFPFLVFMPVMYTISETTVMGINFKEKTSKHIVIAIIAAISNCVGNYILVPTLGATGAAISTGVAYIILFLARTYYSVKYYYVNYHLKRFLISCFAVYLLAIWNSFNSWSIVGMLFSLTTIVILIFCYRDTIKTILNEIKEKMASRAN